MHTLDFIRRSDVVAPSLQAVRAETMVAGLPRACRHVRLRGRCRGTTRALAMLRCWSEPTPAPWRIDALANRTVQLQIRSCQRLTDDVLTGPGRCPLTIPPRCALTWHNCVRTRQTRGIVSASVRVSQKSYYSLPSSRY